ncbi:MAG: hypothetical protein ACT4O0_11235 [Pseudonocardia sp.]|jgi:hypothetical protein
MRNDTSATIQRPTMKRIAVRKPGSVRLTARCSNYGYGMCSCKLTVELA